MRAMGENDVRALYERLTAGWNDHDGDAMAEPTCSRPTPVETGQQQHPNRPMCMSFVTGFRIRRG